MSTNLSRVEFCTSSEPSCLSAAFWGLPFQLLGHCNRATPTVTPPVAINTYMAACHCTCNISSLLMFCLFGGGVPDADGRSVFECGSDVGLVAVCLVWSWAFAGVTSKKGEGAICFLPDSVYVVVLA